MKNIISLTFSILFIMSAVHCSVDATDQNHFPLLRPESPTIVPDETNEIPAALHRYTAEQQQLRQNLTGRYEGISNTNQTATLHIRNDNTIDINIDGIETASSYIVNFFTHTISLIFQRNERIYFYHIQIQPDSTEINGLRASLDNYPVLYFHKLGNLENNETHHDEL